MSLTQIRKILLLFKVKMHTSSKKLIPPHGVRGMKSLDREKFTQTITLPVLKVPEEKLFAISKLCGPFFIKMENFKPVQSIEKKSDENYKKCIYFDPDKIKEWDTLPENIRTALQSYDVNEKNFGFLDSMLTYDNYKYDAILKAVLPENDETVSGFSQIGHIIHLNVRDKLLEYRFLIGQVLIDKIKTCRTVVNKTVCIDNTYRNFQMEVLAGDEDYLVTVKESKCTFQFDFSKVYWNPRLSKEHERILELLKPNDVLFDVFSGVGPFAVPAAKRRCRVFANDLNPESYKWLNHNAKLNKINVNILKTFNMDGKDFILEIFKGFILNICNGTEKLRDGARIHVTMNLPGMAVEFLKYFKGLIEEIEYKDKLNVEILIYVYCFTPKDNQKTIAKEMVDENMGIDMSPHIFDIFCVRNVSPKKEMMKVSFKLSNDIIFNTSCIAKEDSEPPAKVKCRRTTED